MKNFFNFVKVMVKDSSVLLKILIFIVVFLLYFMFTTPLNSLTPKWRINVLFWLFITFGLLVVVIFIKSSYEDYKLSLEKTSISDDIVEDLKNRVTQLEKKYSAWYFHMHGIIFAIAILLLSFVMSRLF